MFFHLHTGSFGDFIVMYTYNCLHITPLLLMQVYVLYVDNQLHHVRHVCVTAIGR